MALNGPILDHNASDCNVECYAWCLRCNAAPLLPTLPSHPADGADAGVHPPHPHGGPPNAVIIAASVAAAVILLAVSYFAVLRHRRRLRSLRSLPAPAPPTAGSRDGDDGDDGFDGASEEVHHVWYIRTMGLDESAIASLAVAEYNTGEPLLAGGCAVCLGEFRDGELVRLLPKCGHAFHVPCIDTWLRAHVNCPLCRAEVVSPAASAAAAAADASDLGSPSSAATAGVADPGNTSAGSPAPVENTQMGIPSSESDREIEELEGEDGLMENVNGIGIGIDPLAVFGSPAEISDLRVTNDLVEGGLQPVRRSVSMDSPFLGAIHVRVPPEGSFGDTAKDSSFGEESVAQDRGKQGSGSKGIVLQKEMERSLSSSGRGFFFVRYGRVARNSILPL